MSDLPSFDVTDPDLDAPDGARLMFERHGGRWEPVAESARTVGEPAAAPEPSVEEPPSVEELAAFTDALREVFDPYLTDPWDWDAAARHVIRLYRGLRALRVPRGGGE